MGANIKVVGVGGAGNNAINRMVDAVAGVEFIAVNTDTQDLGDCRAGTKLAIGEQTTKGLGSGGDPRIGQSSAQESKDMIRDALKDADLVFIAAGMGGGTGTGASPIVAMVAREMGILTIGVVTKPFEFEGPHRMRNAEIGISNLSKFVDCNIVIPNQRLVDLTKKGTTMKQAFGIADSVLIDGVRSIVDLIVKKMTINIDFADVKSITKNAGLAHMGIGRASGENRLIDAIRQAIHNPIAETSIKDASQMIMCVTGGDDLEMDAVNDCGTLVKDVLDNNCNIIFGVDLDRQYNDEVQVIIIATGFPRDNKTQMIIPNQQFVEERTPAAAAPEPKKEKAPLHITVDTPESQQTYSAKDGNLPLYIRKLRGKE